MRQRARHLCQYCHVTEKWQYVLFTVDHVIPQILGGTDDEENLALACFHCNRHKSNRVTAVDPQTGEEVPLFNPRSQEWSAHFTWSADGLHMIGLTPTGRATNDCLQMNRERVISIRAADVQVNRHPPIDDPIQESQQ